MDITKFVIGYREKAFLLGSYDTYRAQLSRRLLTVRKKLGRATPKNAKYQAKAPVTAEDIAKNIEYDGPTHCHAFPSLRWLGSSSSCCSPPSGHGPMLCS